MTIGDETVELYRRDVVECIKALYGDPEFAPHLIFKPERQYVDDEREVRMYGDMHTGDWWWHTQVSVVVP
jgi:Plavaka transposase